MTLVKWFFFFNDKISVLCRNLQCLIFWDTLTLLIKSMRSASFIGKYKRPDFFINSTACFQAVVFTIVTIIPQRTAIEPLYLNVSYDLWYWPSLWSRSGVIASYAEDLCSVQGHANLLVHFLWPRYHDKIIIIIIIIPLYNGSGVMYKIKINNTSVVS